MTQIPTATYNIQRPAICQCSDWLAAATDRLLGRVLVLSTEAAFCDGVLISNLLNIASDLDVVATNTSR